MPFMTFIWTKNTTSDGVVRFNCTVSGVDEDLQETLRQQVLKENAEVEEPRSVDDKNRR